MTSSVDVLPVAGSSVAGCGACGATVTIGATVVVVSAVSPQQFSVQVITASG